MSTISELHPDLSERDLIPVRDLIEDVRVRERAIQFISATVTWVNAFSSFKRTRLRCGLPKSETARYAYGAVLADLKTTGKALLVCLDQGHFTLELTGVSRENLAACVRELSCDDAILEMGFLNSDHDFSDLNALFQVK